MQVESVIPFPEIFDSPAGVEEMTAKKEFDWKWWITTGLVVLGIVGGATWKIADEFSRLDKHLSRVEGAVRILAAKQGGGDTKTLIDEALTVAKNATDAGHTESAKAILDYANRLLYQEQASKAPVSPEFFQNTANNLSKIRLESPEVKLAVFSAEKNLAEYRSSITSGGASGLALDCNNRASAALGPGVPFRDGAILNCSGQLLDGAIWINVVVIDSNIVYRGGPVTLQNVKFVRCTFQVPQNDRGMQLLHFAALDDQNLAIQSDSFPKGM